MTTEVYMFLRELYHRTGEKRTFFHKPFHGPGFI